MDRRPAGDERRAVERLVLLEARAVDDPGQHLARVERQQNQLAPTGSNARPTKRLLRRKIDGQHERVATEKAHEAWRIVVAEYKTAGADEIEQRA